MKESAETIRRLALGSLAKQRLSSDHSQKALQNSQALSEFLPLKSEGFLTVALIELPACGRVAIVSTKLVVALVAFWTYVAVFWTLVASVVTELVMFWTWVARAV